VKVRNNILSVMSGSCAVAGFGALTVAVPKPVACTPR